MKSGRAVAGVLRALRYAWASPNTLIGCLLALPALVGGGRARPHEGVLEVFGGWLDPLLRFAVPIPGGARAMTFGHVVVARTGADLEETRGHERVHVSQCERWGPLFIPAYLAASLWAAIRGRGAYRGNRFEREAFERCAPSNGPREPR